MNINPEFHKADDTGGDDCDRILDALRFDEAIDYLDQISSQGWEYPLHQFLNARRCSVEGLEPYNNDTTFAQELFQESLELGLNHFVDFVLTRKPEDVSLGEALLAMEADVWAIIEQDNEEGE